MKAPITFKVRKAAEVETLARGPSSVWRVLIDALLSSDSESCLELSTLLTKTQGSALRMSARQRGHRLSIATSVDGQRSIISLATQEKHNGQGQDA